jgi:hypothetical protein
MNAYLDYSSHFLNKLLIQGLRLCLHLVIRIVVLNEESTMNNVPKSQ